MTEWIFLLICTILSRN